MAATLDQLEAESNIIGDEFALLLPVCALISSANNKAAQLGAGFKFDETGLTLNWPDYISTSLGLLPSKLKIESQAEPLFLILFEPIFGNQRESYWSMLFKNDIPALAMEYTVSEDNVVQHKHEAWLVWPWHTNTEQKQQALSAASNANDNFSNSMNWLETTQRSVRGSRSELFDAVAAQISCRV